MKPATRESNSQNKSQSKLQLKYQKLLSQIEEQQLYNVNLQNGLRMAHTKLEKEIEPLTKQYNLLQRKLLLIIDKTADQLGVSKHNREWLDAYMTQSSEFLLRIFGYQDKQLAALLQKYGWISVDDIIKDYESQAMAEKFSQLYGFDIDIKEMLEKGEDNYFAENQNRFKESARSKLNDTDEQGYTKKTKADKQAPSKKTEEDKLMARDARSVYMRLIKKYHPDLEQDEVKRSIYTEIVKEVTNAYQENNFFALLKLQIKYLDDNETEATKIAEDMLKRYNKILQKQLNELKQWIYMQHHTSGDIIEDFIDKNGNFSPQKFAAQRRLFEKRNDILNREIAASAAKPKTWFKEYLSFIKNF